MNKETVKNSIKIGSTLIILAFILFKIDTLKSGFSTIFNILLPFIIGGITALFLNVPLQGIETLLKRFVFKNHVSKNLSRGIALIFTIVLLVIFLYISTISIGPVLIDTIKQLTNALPQLINRLDRWFANFSISDSEYFTAFEEYLNNISTSLVSSVQKYFKTILLGGVNLVSGTFSLLFTSFLAISFAIYLLFYKETLGGQIKRLLFAFLDDDRAKVLIISGKRFYKNFSNFMGGSAIEAVIFGVMVFIAMTIFNLPHKTTLALLSGALTFIPYFGPFFAAFIGFILIGAIRLRQGLIYLILSTTLQQIEGNIIYPRVVGSQVGLPGIWVLVSVTIGGSVAGILGMMLAVPVTTVIYQTLGDIIEYKIIKKSRDSLNELNPPALSEIMSRNSKINIEKS